ncbi:MAG: nucleotidyltransferase domain-containing protein [Candidatus Eremiobacteraeota bacterium]|nr:nucleotidyltransferase domain-containing protein [Candidatus Eremiobacteraeota bacterium]
MSTMDIRKWVTLERSLIALRERESWLRSKGVVHAAVFGSVARGDDDQSSDVDVLLELAPNAPVGTPELLQIEAALVAALGRSVDVVSRGGLKSPRHDHIIKEMVPAF